MYSNDKGGDEYVTQEVDASSGSSLRRGLLN